MSQPAFERKGQKMIIKTRYEHKRGCGWRKAGGLYLVSDGLGIPCGKLPIPLRVCPTCGHGIKPSRGWTWINGTELVKDVTCQFSVIDIQDCKTCPLNGDPGRVGLIWIGEKYYKTASDFTNEAIRQGISRRIAMVPRDFKLGKTWVWLAHRKGLTQICPDCNGSGAAFGIDCDFCNGEGYIYTPAVFHAFKPTAIEYVVTGKESDAELEQLFKRGITPVKIKKLSKQKEMVGSH